MHKNCLTQENLRLFLAEEISATQKETLELHLTDCTMCRRQLAAVFSESAEVSKTFVAPASLIERVKDLPEKQAQANKIYTPGPSLFGGKRFFWQLAFGASLLVCFGLAGFYVLRYQPSNTTDALRNGSSVVNPLKLLSPVDGANISEETIEFRWVQIPNAKTNTLVISDEKGDIVAQRSTTQESLAFNISNLAEGKHYFWFVKVKLADGTTMDSDTAKFLFVK